MNPTMKVNEKDSIIFRWNPYFFSVRFNKQIHIIKNEKKAVTVDSLMEFV